MLAVRRQVEERVVDRPAVRLPLLDADREPYAVLARDRSEAVGRRPGDRHSVLGEQAEPFRVAVPDRLGVDPDRRARDEGLGENDELGTVRGSGGGAFGHAVDRRLAVHEDVRRLDSGDSDSCH